MIRPYSALQCATCVRSARGERGVVFNRMFDERGDACGQRDNPCGGWDVAWAYRHPGHWNPQRLEWNGLSARRADDGRRSQRQGEALRHECLWRQGPEYYAITGTADSSNHIKLDIKLIAADTDYHFEGPFDAERLSLTGTLSEIYKNRARKPLLASGGGMAHLPLPLARPCARRARCRAACTEPVSALHPPVGPGGPLRRQRRGVPPASPEHLPPTTGVFTH
jgi:hypothetical protein